MSTSSDAGAPSTGARDFVTVEIGSQLFGIPIDQVHDVFRPQHITHVPLASPGIAGVLNLRGRIVTVIDCRARLGLPPRTEGANVMAVGVEYGDQSYGLLIDDIGEVLSFEPSAIEPNPANLDAHWRSISKGVYRLKGRLLVVPDVAAILDMREREAA
ncbi:MAG: chemotaxis protein CheW [Rhizomicrobium sp.]